MTLYYLVYVKVIIKNAVQVKLECRYMAQITLGSASFDVEEPASKKMLIFDFKVVSKIEADEQLKDPETPVYQQTAFEIVNELFLNWSGERVPIKIEVIAFLLVDTNDVIRTITQDVEVLLKLTYQNVIGVEEPKKEHVSEIVEEITQT